MSRTNKDKKSNKKWNKRVCEHAPGIKKLFQRHSNKMSRQTPITSPIPDYEYDENGNVINKSTYDVENIPKKDDKWKLD